ncbi:MAG: hypothetical protein N4A54_04680 [Peptostreptococcaceae bacterium]|jgi:hypothetical protein|nr:hypothetical protein [Peptostreptococcaceae bacterium]
MKLLDDLKEVIYDFFGFIIPGLVGLFTIFIYYSSYIINKGNTNIFYDTMYFNNFEFNKVFGFMFNEDFKISFYVILGLLIIAYILGITLNVMARGIFNLIKNTDLHFLISSTYIKDDLCNYKKLTCDNKKFNILKDDCEILSREEGFECGLKKYIGCKYLNEKCKGYVKNIFEKDDKFKLDFRLENSSFYNAILRRMDGQSLVQKYIAKYNLFMNTKMIIFIIIICNFIAGCTLNKEILSISIFFILLIMYIRLDIVNKIYVYTKKEKNYLIELVKTYNRKFLFVLYYIFILFCMSFTEINLKFTIINFIIYTIYLALDYEHIRHYNLSEQERFLGMAYLAHLKSEKNLIDDIEEAYYNFDLKNKRRV